MSVRVPQAGSTTGYSGLRSVHWLAMVALAAVAATSALFAGCAAAEAASKAPAELRIERFTKAGHGSVNSFLLVGPASVVLVDAQRTIPEAQGLVAAIKASGKPLEAIVVTHEHPDHIGGLDVVMGAFPGTTIMASDTTTAFIRDNGPGLANAMRNQFGFGPSFPERIPVPSRGLAQDESLDLAGSIWRVKQLGKGEAGGMTLLVNEGKKLLIMSDLAGNHVTPWLADGHIQAWIQQLQALRSSFDGYTAYPGHGDPGPASTLLAQQLQYLLDFKGLIQAEIAPGSSATLSAPAKARVRTALEARYPGQFRVAPDPNLIEVDADAVAAELSRKPTQP